MKTKRYFSQLIIFILTYSLITSCLNDDDAITYSGKDVSSRITGFGTEKTGPGAELTINGSHMDEVERVFIGNVVIAKKSFISQSESSITFSVPTSVTVGSDEPSQVMVVFPGSETAIAKIDVIPLQAISSFTPYTATTSDIITLNGVNFDLVTGVKLGDLNATIIPDTKTSTLLQFTVPAGFDADNKITLVGTAGDTKSSSDLVACTSAAVADCAPGINLNTGFELGTGDVLTNWAQQNGNTFIIPTIVPNEFFRGSRGVKVVRDGTLGSGEWRLQLISDLAPTEIGAAYTVYIWARATVAGGSMRVSTTPSALYTGNQNVPTTWTRLAFTFTANVANTGIALDMNGNNTVATTFYIDDVKLIKN